MRDKSCADVIRLMMKYTPDCVAWFDFTTLPPTLNIDRRGNLPVKNIKTRGTDLKRDGFIITGFKPKARYDLQVPGVIAKFQQTFAKDGKTYLVTTVDKYPPTAKDNAPRMWVQTIDLVGGTRRLCEADGVSDLATKQRHERAGLPDVVAQQEFDAGRLLRFQADESRGHVRRAPASTSRRWNASSIRAIRRSKRPTTCPQTGAAITANSSPGR